jgi:hypothetical protein
VRRFWLTERGHRSGGHVDAMHTDRGRSCRWGSSRCVFLLSGSSRMFISFNFIFLILAVLVLVVLSLLVVLRCVQGSQMIKMIFVLIYFLEDSRKWHSAFSVALTRRFGGLEALWLDGARKRIVAFIFCNNTLFPGHLIGVSIRNISHNRSFRFVLSVLYFV